MREIKFRGKRLDNGEWVYGNLVKYPKTEKWVPQSEIWFFDDEGGGEHYYIVNPTTVGQFTGLYDKDGNEIYEGDICKYSYINPMTREERTFVWKVEWSNGAYWLHSIDDSLQDTLLWIQHKEIEVIGNIYENPELLQKGGLVNMKKDN